MDTSNQSKKEVINFNWWAILLILAFGAGSLYFGVRSSRLSKKDEQHVARQSVLEAQRDSVRAKADKLEAKIVILEAGVKQANKNTDVAENTVAIFKKKYLDLKNQVPPSPCDSFPVLVECDKQLEYRDNFITILKANVLSYSRLTDTLQLKNKYLDSAYGLCLKLSTDQKEELTDTRKKLRRGKILNFGLTGALAGAIVVLFVK